MTRFARSEGSKGSNAKQYEEATPWNELKKQQDATNPTKDESSFSKKYAKKANTNDETDADKNNPFVTENGQKYKQFKTGVKKPWIDITYEENDVMTLYDKFFVKKEDVAELDEYKKQLQDEGHIEKQIKNKVMTKERRAHNKLRVQLMYAQINISKKGTANKKLKKAPTCDNEIETLQKSKISKPNLPDDVFQENESMAMYEGYWVPRSETGHLDRIREWKVARIIKAREDGSSDLELTEEETIKLARDMKKEKRRKHDVLCKRLKKEFKREEAPIRSKPEKMRKMTKFDGFSVTQESADRLKYLQKELISKDVPMEEVTETIKLERRKDERDLKKSRKLICFNCRQPGHTVAQCNQTKSIEICFKCGSTEHMSRNCSKSGPFSHAQCFHCEKTGHLARECPDNPNGLYPNGGCCRECSSVRHLARDCPSVLEKKAGATITLKCMSAGDNPEEMEF